MQKSGHMVLKGVKCVLNDKIRSNVIKGANWVHNDKLKSYGLEFYTIRSQLGTQFLKLGPKISCVYKYFVFLTNNKFLPKYAVLPK